MDAQTKKIILPLALLVLISLAAWALSRAAVFDPTTIQDFVGSYGAWGPLIYILIYAIAPSLLVPGLPLTIAAGVLFGPVYGIIYTSIGATIGSSVAFLISRKMGRRWVSERIIPGSKLEMIDRAIEKHGWKAVAAARLIPLIPFNALNYALGLTAVKFSHFVIASFIFMLPGIAAYVLFAGSLTDLVSGRANAPYMLIATVALIIGIAAAATAIKRALMRG